MKKKSVLLSGIQPSGTLTLGNYIGAISNWVRLQQEYDCLFMIVDLHTITVRQDPADFRKNTYDLIALYLACGLDFDKNLVFLQSHVLEHSELAWILNCYTNMGELKRMTQFKDKSQRFPENINVGLFDYPVLMAADILIYNTALVPVGEDQKQHLELARDIAIRFNGLYGDIFKIPEPYIPQVGARIMSLQDPTKKMSKSLGEAHYIALLDPPDVILKKFKRAVTDSGSEVCYDPKKGGIINLMSILSCLTSQTFSEIETQYAGQGYGKFKTDVAEVVIETLRPIQEAFVEIRADTNKIDQLLWKSAKSARTRARVVLDQVREALGFIPGK